MNKPPCYKCQERYLGCHDNCKEFIKYRSIIDKARAEKREGKEFAAYLQKTIYDFTGKGRRL